MQAILVILMILLAVACAALGVCLYAEKKSLRSCAEQLRSRKKSGSAALVCLAAPGAAAEELLESINELLQSREEGEASFRNAEQALRRQIANISHDLRTPLTSILGYLQLLEGNTLTPAERSEYLGIIEGRAKALQSLITSFYDLSRLDSGEYPLEKTKVDLYSVLSALMASFYGDLTASGLDVTVALEEHLPQVTGDPAAVLRVFTNLIRNALDHGQGRLEVRLGMENGRVVSTFSNGSGGLTQADMAHVFDRSFTSDQNRTARNTGLGLAIVKALTEQMDACVEAKLEQGEFSIHIVWKT